MVYLPKGFSRVILITGECHHPCWWEANLYKSHKGLCDVTMDTGVLNEWTFIMTQSLRR